MYAVLYYTPKSIDISHFQNGIIGVRCFKRKLSTWSFVTLRGRFVLCDSPLPFLFCFIYPYACLSIWCVSFTLIVHLVVIVHVDWHVCPSLSNLEISLEWYVFYIFVLNSLFNLVVNTLCMHVLLFVVFELLEYLLWCTILGLSVYGGSLVCRIVCFCSY